MVDAWTTHHEPVAGTTSRCTFYDCLVLYFTLPHECGSLEELQPDGYTRWYPGRSLAIRVISVASFRMRSRMVDAQVHFLMSIVRA